MTLILSKTPKGSHTLSATQYRHKTQISPCYESKPNYNLKIGQTGFNLAAFDGLKDLMPDLLILSRIGQMYWSQLSHRIMLRLQLIPYQEINEKKISKIEFDIPSLSPQFTQDHLNNVTCKEGRGLQHHEKNRQNIPRCSHGLYHKELVTCITRRSL